MPPCGAAPPEPTMQLVSPDKHLLTLIVLIVHTTEERRGFSFGVEHFDIDMIDLVLPVRPTQAIVNGKKTKDVFS